MQLTAMQRVEWSDWRTRTPPPSPRARSRSPVVYGAFPFVGYSGDPCRSRSTNRSTYKRTNQWTRSCPRHARPATVRGCDTEWHAAKRRAHRSSGRAPLQLRGVVVALGSMDANAGSASVSPGRQKQKDFGVGPLGRKMQRATQCEKFVNHNSKAQGRRRAGMHVRRLYGRGIQLGWRVVADLVPLRAVNATNS